MGKKIFKAIFAFLCGIASLFLVTGCGSTAAIAPNNTVQNPQTFSISGTQSPASKAAGATVALTGASSATTTVDASGNYTFSGLSNGTYLVTPSKTGLFFIPANQSVNINGSSRTGVNFTAGVVLQSITMSAASSALAKGTTDQLTAVGLQ